MIENLNPIPEEQANLHIVENMDVNNLPEPNAITRTCNSSSSVRLPAERVSPTLPSNSSNPFTRRIPSSSRVMRRTRLSTRRLPSRRAAAISMRVREV